MKKPLQLEFSMRLEYRKRAGFRIRVEIIALSWFTSGYRTATLKAVTKCP